MSAKHRYSLRSALNASALTVIACVGLTACSSPKSMSSSINPVNWLTPYKVDVIQGNFVSKEQVTALQPGMPRAQVKDILGTSLVTDVFHADRWDYVFTLKRQGVAPQAYKFTVFFNGDQLARFEGDDMPSEAEFIASLDNKRKLGKVPVLEATEEQLKSAEKSASSSSRDGPAGGAGSAAAPSMPAGTSAKVYPPLESSPQ